MAFSYTERGYDMEGRGIVYGNWTQSSATAGALSVPFRQVYHASFSNSVLSTPVTYAAGKNNFHVDVTTTNSDSGTYMIYGE